MRFNKALQAMKNGRSVRLPEWHEAIYWKMLPNGNIYEFFQGKQSTLVDNVKISNLASDEWQIIDVDTLTITNENNIDTLKICPTDNQRKYYHISIKSRQISSGTTLTWEQIKQLYKYLHKILETED